MNKRILAAGFAASTLLAAPVIAQEVVIPEQSPDELLGGWVLGAAVESTDGERIGSIDDILLEPDSGDINAAIISVGGFLGFGSKDIAVEWSELQINWDAREVVLAMSRDQLEEYEEFVARDREFIPAPADEGVGGDAMGTGAAGGGAMDGGGDALGGN